MAVRFAGKVRFFVTYNDGQSAAHPRGYRAPHYTVRMHDRAANKRQTYVIDAADGPFLRMMSANGRTPAADSSEAYTIVVAGLVRAYMAIGGWNLARTIVTETGQPLYSVLPSL